MTKLNAKLQKILDTYTKHWAIDEQELSLRINKAITNYKRLPVLGDMENYSEILIYKPSFYEIIQIMKSNEFNNLEVNHARTTAAGGSYKVCFIKTEQQQQEDIKRITEGVTEAYKAELEAIKSNYIEQIVADSVEQKKQDAAAKLEEEEQELKSALLELIQKDNRE